MRTDISWGEARRIAFIASGLGQGAFATGLDGAEAAVAHLGSVQIDTISVVERAHHHIMFSRVPRYATSMIAGLETGRRSVFEYWSHAAAFLPLADWRYCIPRMERIRAAGHEWFHADPKFVSHVRDRIAAEGPLRAQDFEGGEDRRGEGWWDWRPAKIALEYLFHAGELVAVSREGFQKRYDLVERALPPDLDLRRPTEEEMAAWHVDTATRTLGVFARRDVAYMRKDGLQGIGRELSKRVEEGRLVEIAVGTAAVKGKTTWYASPEALDSITASDTAHAPEDSGNAKARIRILSPFDPLVIDRKRLERLFGFGFTIECYVPAPKRRFGYFALPLFWDDGKAVAEPAGLLDAKAERAERRLILRRLRIDWVPGAKRPSIAAALGAELSRFARFNGCDDVVLERLECGDPKLEALVKSRILAMD